MNTKQYGALSYSNSLNLGDNVQSLAALNFLPTDRKIIWIDRDNVDNCNEQTLKNVEGNVHCIMNGWYDGSFTNFPFHNKIKPLLVSMHINEVEKTKDYDILESFKIKNRVSMFDPVFTNYYNIHRPVGCRDYTTMRKLQQIGVKCYFSGCLTLTLKNPNPNVKRKDTYIVDCDITCPNLFSKVVPERIIKTAYYEHHALHSFQPNEEKLLLAQNLLDKYAKAKLVITSRLHCLLPCIAFGTPCVFLHEDKNDVRFMGLTEIANCCTLENIPKYDWDNISNPMDISYITKPLEQSVKNFLM